MAMYTTVCRVLFKGSRRFRVFVPALCLLILLCVFYSGYGWHVVVKSDSLAQTRDNGETTQSCWKCLHYPEVPLQNLSKCITCYQEIHGNVFIEVIYYLSAMEIIVKVSAEANERRKLLLEFDARAKTAQKCEQRLPDVIGIGQRKCGTGWLYYVLQRHPAIKTNPFRREMHFFNMKKNYEKGVAFYKSQMPNITEFELSMEKTPNYFNLGNREMNFPVPYLVRKVVPKAKLLLILCNPVHRAISDFVQMNITKESVLPERFEDYVKKYLPLAKAHFSSGTDINQESLSWRNSDASSIILSLGIYHAMLKVWLNYFPAEQIHIISMEELLENPGPVFEKVQDFLEIPRFLLPEDFEKNPETGLYCVSRAVAIDSKLYRIPANCMYKGAKGRTRGITGSAFTVSEDVMTRLEEFYKPFDEELFRMLGRRLW